MSEHVGRTGKVRPPQLPPSVALSPAQSACKDGQPVKHPVDAVPWSGPGWAALAFEPRSAFRYQYAWVTDGKTFTARAIGDLDCDGVTSTFEEFGKVTAGEVQCARWSSRPSAALAATRPLP